MKVTKKIEKLENSSVKLTVTIGKADVAASYNEVVAKYAKNIQIPGFRKGKVPVSVLERKYGDALKNDAVSEIVEKALGDIFEEMDKNKSDDRPLPYSQPTIDDIPLLDTTKDLTFAVKYDVFPQVEVKNFDGIEIKVPEVKITDDDLKEELEAIRQRNAMVLDKKDDEAVAKDDIVTVNYCELDDKDAEIAGSQRQDFVFTVGTEQNIYKFDNEIIGMKKGETKDLTKEVDGENKKVRVTVTAVKVRNVPELDDELAQDVSDKYNNLEDMKNDIKKNLETALENKLKEISFYEIEKVDSINSLYTSNSVVSFMDLDALTMNDVPFIKKFIYNLKENLDDKKITIISGKNDTLKTFLFNDDELGNIYFNFKLVGARPSVNDVYNEIIRTNNISDEFNIKILDYITNTYEKSGLDFDTYVSNLKRYISFNKELPEIEKSKSIDEVFKSTNPSINDYYSNSDKIDESVKKILFLTKEVEISRSGIVAMDFNKKLDDFIVNNK